MFGFCKKSQEAESKKAANEHAHSFIMGERVKYCPQGEFFGFAEVINKQVDYLYRIGYVPFYDIRLENGEKVQGIRRWDIEKLDVKFEKFPA